MGNNCNSVAADCKLNGGQPVYAQECSISDSMLQLTFTLIETHKSQRLGPSLHRVTSGAFDMAAMLSANHVPGLPNQQQPQCQDAMS